MYNGVMSKDQFGCTETCVRPTNSQCHCTACHLTFRHVGDFERHRTGPTSKRECLPAPKLGLECEAGIWASAESHAKVAATVARLAGSRSSRLENPASAA